MRRGRLGPGEMLCVDPDAGGLQGDDTVKRWLAGRAPYAEWAADGLRPFSSGKPLDETPEAEALLAHQGAYGVTKEEVAMVLKPMAADAKEPTFSMGDDIPFATASAAPAPAVQRGEATVRPGEQPADRPPPRAAGDVAAHLPRTAAAAAGRGSGGGRGCSSCPRSSSTRRRCAMLLDPTLSPFPAERLDATFPVGEGPEGLRRALERLGDDAERAVEHGIGVLVVSDAGVDATRAAIPSLLATGVVHHRLVRVHRRQDASLVIDSGDARDTHAVAALLGYGADAICPRLALETVAALADDGQLGELHAAEAQAKLQAALEDGVLKIFSKMGISTVDGYRAAQIFEALGLAPEVIDLCLVGHDLDRRRDRLRRARRRRDRPPRGGIRGRRRRARRARA